MRSIISIIAFLIFSTIGISQNQKLIPVNECDKDSSLYSFVIKLKKAISLKDKQFVLSVLDNHITNSFGGDGGIEEFKERWKLDNNNSELWIILDKIVNLGGAFNKSKNTRDQFVFPYVFNLELENCDDYYYVMVVIKDKLAVKEQPYIDAKEISELSYDVVWTEFDNAFKPKYSSPGWTYIETLDNKIKGYVESDYLYSPIGYRMFLSKIDNNWKITCLVAGD